MRALQFGCHGNLITEDLVVHILARMSVPTQPLEGFHYDELSKIRVIDPAIATETTELKEECKEFVDSEFLNKAHLDYQLIPLLCSVCIIRDR